MPRLLNRVSPGQLDALRMAANGFTSRQIAGRLGVSEQAVHLRLKAVAHALGARNRTHAVVVAARIGLLDIHDTRLPAQRPAAATRADAPDGLAPSRAHSGP